MRLNEVFRFSSREYTRRIADADVSHAELVQKIKKKRRGIITFEFISIMIDALTLAAGVVTGGPGALPGFVFSVLTGRNIDIMERKLRLLEAERERRRRIAGY